MKRFLLLVISCSLGAVAAAPSAAAQGATIVFQAQGTPSSGIPEPVRGFPICLLRKSFADIHKEATIAYPLPDMAAFVDKLDVSPELKTWMKKNDTVILSGEDFLHLIKPADVINVPEFYKAYMNHNADDQSLSNFPKLKVKPSEKKKHPEKYAKAEDDFHQALQKYITDNPQTLDGMDAELTTVDPGAKWKDQEAKRIPQIDRYALELARSKYFAGQVETNLQGRGEFSGLPAGTYWVSSLNVHATVGDAWLRWDVPVTVGPGQTARVLLSNADSLSPVAQESH
ncbi:MAG TPA: hypothetical protein VMU43_09610 [Candidatus Acidoferrum sp.]|nr:hypothetical protein [Candidatus Acidoferrum sp.]